MKTSEKEKEKRYSPGLEGVPAARTKLSRVDGEEGRLTIVGYEVEEFAGKASFEETIYLLWNGDRPNPIELNQFGEELRNSRRFSKVIRTIIEEAVYANLPLIDILRIGSAALSLGAGPENAKKDAMAVLATFPLIVAWAYRLSKGVAPVLPRQDLDIAANFLYMLEGKEPEHKSVRALNTYLNTVCDHGLNASTFAARVIISTQSDMISAVTGGLGALKGPLHGGAPGPALDTVFEIGEKKNAEKVLREKLSGGERLMGFGHRLYKVRDPRADVLAVAAKNLYDTEEKREFYDLAMHVEKTALRLLKEFKPDRILQTNVEFYTALLLNGIGFPTQLFTPVFAMGRAAGWTAHCFEQLKERILRPDAIYIGEEGRKWN
ncbi:citrate synthase/methylcitrate synthase [Leptospira wolffii]|uniref:Citrate synthase n=1 Tax=Leptospira wolffii TaxID=409998 RepID=A0A2M9ZF02_9LEPT|nr:citrate synthase/methylcitrate synthase [Leptospira wolffii]PJZ66976.1 citrate synthase/methylcitrate synthase [Leptospira wolffii]TGK61949.1 citrate synthase/methylcitrate synthase [Leptospira wolffii]TGK68550.1 citrate synthase/methylcitrate synthase [Leptospira wolffii]TGK74667.1 citrate synthase/methylcitrate synthase [Leptospira wolffii]TGL31757.1 citrate synthase/methylcitrate synthase [Leptospira wolffii]